MQRPPPFHCFDPCNDPLSIVCGLLARSEVSIREMIAAAAKESGLR